MSDGQTSITVRGEAYRVVDPDRCTLHCELRARRSNRSDAIEALAATQRAVTDGLAGAGGVVGSAAADRAPLTWVAGSVQTHHDHPQSPLARRGGLVASLSVTVRVRDFALLDDVAALLTGTENVNVHHVAWELDDDSPAGREVRADAVRAAVQRGRDYAAALGATITAVEQLADVGLIEHRPASFQARAAMGRAGAAPEDEPAIVLDPQPQELSAQVEARLIATGVDLIAH